MKIALLALCIAAMPAFAADDHKGHEHDKPTGAHAGHDDKARYGGVVSVVKDVNYELVAKPDGATLYVTDHGQSVDLKGASAKLTLLSASAKSEVTLQPAGDKLEGKTALSVAAGAKAVATFNQPGKAPVTVKFTLR
ncbi:hypothetical protein ACVNIS_08335 [Sphaerotilaceae bacterium SBD11-9]